MESELEPISDREVDELFVDMWRRMECRMHATAISKGFWDSDRNNGEMIALMHSELSEALESLRNGSAMDDKIPGYSGVEAEFADVVIRIMDMAAARGLRVAEALVAKARYNETRQRMHGGKKF